MKTYYIYDMQTNEKIYELKAFSIVDAELKAIEALNAGSDDIYALTDNIE